MIHHLYAVPVRVTVFLHFRFSFLFTELSLPSPASPGPSLGASSPQTDISTPAGRNSGMQCTCISCHIKYLQYCSTLAMFEMTVLRIVSDVHCVKFWFCFLFGCDITGPNAYTHSDIMHRSIPLCSVYHFGLHT